MTDEWLDGDKLDNLLTAKASFTATDEFDDGSFLCYTFTFPALREFVKSLRAHLSLRAAMGLSQPCGARIAVDGNYTCNTCNKDWMGTPPPCETATPPDREALILARDALEEATTYTSSPSWSPSMTAEVRTALAAINAAIAASQPSTTKGNAND